MVCKTAPALARWATAAPRPPATARSPVATMPRLYRRTLPFMAHRSPLMVHRPWQQPPLQARRNGVSYTYRTRVLLSCVPSLKRSPGGAIDEYDRQTLQPARPPAQDAAAAHRRARRRRDAQEHLRRQHGRGQSRHALLLRHRAEVVPPARRRWVALRRLRAGRPRRAGGGDRLGDPRAGGESAQLRLLRPR